ncbi:PIN domain-containing protein [Candidatus Aerophobetes bacterium]|nr:PIN domain-containing protein [Candidatus Aerophobetes bacterium]
MRFLDTNLLIHYFTRDDEGKAQKVLGLLKRVERNEERVITSSLVIFETVFTLQSFYKVSRKKIKKLVSPILELRGLKLLDKEIYQLALDIYVKKNISFADAFNTAFILKKEIKEIYSYDEDFDRIEEIRRMLP